MENASKALIMAAGVLIALLIIGALILMFNNLTAYQETEVQTSREAQINEFNNQYETYNRDNVRGSDLLSLLNRIVDYNRNRSQEGYQEMRIDIQIANKSVIQDKFCYDSTENPKLLESSYNESNMESKLLSKVKKLENKYNPGSINYISNLASNISKVTSSEEDTKKILAKDLSDYGGYNQVKEDTITYYEYSQLKKAYFDCKETKYNDKTGRIVYMKFEFNSNKNFE